jgi:hypothetical protein
MDAVDRLVAIEDIKALKGRYQRALDLGRWDEFEQCLTEDFSVFEDGLPDRIHGREAVMAAVRLGFDMVAEGGGWKHWVILPDIEITSTTTATGTWTFAVPDYGHCWYEDRYAVEDGRWKVQWTHVHVSERLVAGQTDEAKARLAEVLASLEATDASAAGAG